MKMCSVSCCLDCLTKYDVCGLLGKGSNPYQLPSILFGEPTGHESHVIRTLVFPTVNCLYRIPFSTVNMAPSIHNIGCSSCEVSSLEAC